MLGLFWGELSLKLWKWEPCLNYSYSVSPSKFTKSYNPWSPVGRSESGGERGHEVVLLEAPCGDIQHQQNGDSACNSCRPRVCPLHSGLLSDREWGPWPTSKNFQPYVVRLNNKFCWQLGHKKCSFFVLLCSRERKRLLQSAQHSIPGGWYWDLGLLFTPRDTSTCPYVCPTRKMFDFVPLSPFLISMFLSPPTVTIPPYLGHCQCLPSGLFVSIISFHSQSHSIISGLSKARRIFQNTSVSPHPSALLTTQWRSRAQI